MSLFQRHHFHSLAVHGDCAVCYPGGHRGHGHLHRPVALGEAGYYSLVHAHRDLDQSWGEKGKTVGGDQTQLQKLAGQGNQLNSSGNYIPTSTLNYTPSLPDFNRWSRKKS